MLFRSLAEIYENLQTFQVAELDGRVAGCCALQIVWSNLAEIKSLAVSQDNKGTGLGEALVKAAVRRAGRLGLSRVFVLTMEPEFFQKLGFQPLERDDLPMKVWSDCARCTKQDHCDDGAMVRESGA